MNSTSLYLKSLLEDLSTASILNQEEQPDVLVQRIMVAAKQIIGFREQKREKVLSIFSALPVSLKLGGQWSIYKGERWQFPFSSLSLDTQFFPKNEAQGSLSSVVGQFKEEYQKIQHMDLLPKAETLLNLMHKYLTVFPSFGAEELSLYDMAKSKAAIAICLHKTGLEQEYPFLLVGGDLSGIQEFIYAIVSKNASKSLKGRSNYLHLEGQSILAHLLEQLELFQANVVYASGGSFYVLAPNTPEIKAKLDVLEQTFAKRMFVDFEFALSLQIASIELKADELKGDVLGKRWATLQDKLQLKKRNKFNGVIAEKFDELFEAIPDGGELKRDAVTNDFISEEEYKKGEVFELGGALPKVVDKPIENDDRLLIKKKNQKQIIAGYFLKKDLFNVNGGIDFRINDINDFDQQRKLQLAGDEGVHYILNRFDSALKFNQDPKSVFRVNNTNFLKGDQIMKGTTYGFTLYGGNDYPRIKMANEDELPTTFSEMAGMPENSGERAYAIPFKEINFKRLGVLRMDVDGLGGVFKHGFGETGTISHFSALSRQLDWFFKGYLNTIWEQEVYKKNTQIIYSGGDDLFIVGKWDILLTMAFEIREKFTAWTCGHSGLGISGGLTLVTHKFPIMRAADLSGDAEKKAKKHTYSSLDREYPKNAITLFGQPLNWEKELPIVQLLKNNLVKHIKWEGDNEQGGKLPKSLLSHINAFHEYYIGDESNKDKKSASMVWKWRLSYLFARMKDRYKKAEGYPTFLDELIKGIMTNRCIYAENYQKDKYSFFDLLHIASIWAGWEIRSKHKVK
jgi:CRISPR-associated protein Csm1